MEWCYSPSIVKTALAVHAAHRLAADFPDGQLFVDLHSGPGGDLPADPTEALDRMLRALGCAGGGIPDSLAERSALYRSLLARRRVLLLLDNAATDDQVQPLLPGAGDCLVLVTSRRRLPGLDGARPLSLDVLPPREATELFTRVAGERRITAAPPELADRLVELCGRLPLAIRIAAARLRARPSWTLAHLADRLRDEQARLGELEAGQRSVSAAFGLSYRQLTGPQQRLFRLLGLHPGADIDRYAAAALAGASLPGTSRRLEELVDTHLLQSPQPDRYRFHDLLRTYAATTSAATEPEPARRAALTRLYDFYAYAARVATEACYRHAAGSRPDLAPPAAAVPRLDRPDDAAAWLEAERTNLLAVAARAADDSPRHTVLLSGILFRHLDHQSHLTDAERLHTHAHTAAGRTGDHTGQAHALRFLATVHARRGRVEPARHHFRQALALYRTATHRPGQASALYSLGLVSMEADDFHQALDYCQQALSLFQQAGEVVNLARVNHALGDIQARFGQHQQALDHLRQSLALHRQAGNPDGHGRATHGLGEVYRLQRRHELALGHLQRAANIHRETGNRGCLAYTLDSLGCLYRQLGQLDRALDHLHQALELHRQLGVRPGEAKALNNLGQTVRMAGQVGQARAYHRQALALARQLGTRYEQARAHAGLAHCHTSLDHARRHWQEALAIYTELDLPESAEIRAHLRDAHSRS